jgi:hypothetical protein
MDFIKAVWDILVTGAKWLGNRGRWKWAAGAMAALLMAILFLQVRSTRSANDTLRSDLAAAQGEIQLYKTAREADATALAARAELRTTATNKEALGRAKTEKALAANPEWASVPVPRDVADSLQQD